MSRRVRKQKGALRLQNTVRLGAEGIAKVLGDLEARVMEAVWALGRPTPARGVYEHIVDDHPVALLTVVTVLNKLVEKRLLTRVKRDDVFHYDSTVTREEFLTRASRQIVEGILSFGTEALAASFVDVLAEEDPEQLARLARLVRQRLREQET